MKKWIISGAVLLLTLSLFAAYMFWPMKLDTSGAGSAYVYVSNDFGWELKSDGDLVPQVYSYDFTLEQGSPEFAELISLLDGLSFHRTLGDRAGGGSTDVHIRLHDSGGAEVCVIDTVSGRLMVNGQQRAMGFFSADRVAEFARQAAAISPPSPQ
ncbi:MAG TPA: hypothetical protein IAB47_05980 [Candidatus Scatomorpha merdigallinarum]|nr:hypothetical protein [Candidatus Scatomorpha merdigallinarum]